ncbi:hypothetical protein [Derxia gummosa]|uniref:Uncharacterized protein n=1 Tax=Derxia gummosa DSM 723 TaxID=1121388 RepID=A0A8B6X6A3_9BURK|nr:hypothetical protein [Derxia gummosa]
MKASTVFGRGRRAPAAQASPRGAAARLLSGLLGCVLVLLAGCGGSGGDAPAQTSTPRPALAGTASDGSAAPVADVSVKGASGTPRTSRNSFGGHAYTVDLSGLSAPYALRTQLDDGQPVVSVAFAAGRANLTPFTHLIVARLAATDPSDWYSALGGTGGPDLATLSATDAASASAWLRRELARKWSLTLPAADPLTAPFEARAGDAMQDAILAFDSALAARGRTLAGLTADVVLEARRCRAERISLTAADGADDFCIASKTTARDPANATLQRLSFTNGNGDSLVLRLRGDAVADLAYTPAGGTALRCTGANCAGITVGAPAGDLSRRIGFAGTVLRGADGARLTLDGSLAAAAPGIDLPALPCDDNRWYLIAADNSVTADCTDSANPQTRGRKRQLYTFLNSAAADFTWIEIGVNDDASVASVLVYGVDPATFQYVARWRCLASDCNGVSVSAPDAGGNRAIALDDTRLARVLADGGLDGASSVRLRASFTVADAFTDWTPATCPTGADRITARYSDETDAAAFCPIDDLDGMPLKGGYLDADGNPGYFATGYVSDPMLGNFSVESVTVETGAGGAIRRVSFTRRDGESFACDGDCTGVSVSAPDGAGRQRVSFTAARLGEHASLGLAGDRSLLLDGGFEVAAPGAGKRASAARLPATGAAKRTAAR